MSKLQKIVEFPVAQMVKNLRAMQETRVLIQGWEVPEGKGNPLQYSCLENSMDRISLWDRKEPCLENPHGQRTLAGYTPWGHKESDATKRLTHSLTHTHTHTHTCCGPWGHIDTI